MVLLNSELPRFTVRVLIDGQAEDKHVSTYHDASLLFTNTVEMFRRNGWEAAVQLIEPYEDAILYETYIEAP